MRSLFCIMTEIFIFFILILGAAFGSFFNVCIYRIPLKKNIVYRSSHCPVCNTEIRHIHNIPIFSYLVLKGKCNECGTKISIRYLLVEIITPIIFILIFLMNNRIPDFIFFKYIIFASFSIIIFFIDLDHKLIPDVLSLPLILIGLGFSLIPNVDINFISSLIGSASGFLFFFTVAYGFKKVTGKDSLGGGDIKYIAAVGSFLGYFGILFTIIFSSFVAIVTLLLLRHDLKKEFPYGPFLVLGSLIYILCGDFLLSSYLGMFNF
jgi:leader peptidase (prepilin peptidase) / N-methyltransferase